MAGNFTPENIKRVVVRGTSWVGDAVMTVPALRELRRALPAAHITLATRSWAEGIFADADYVDDLLIEEHPQGWRTGWRQSAAWRARRFDLAVLLQNSFQSAFVARLSGARYRFGYAADGRSFLLTHAVRVPAWRRERHEVFFYLHLIAELEKLLTGTTRVGAREPLDRLEIAPARLAEARLFLRERGVNMKRPFVVLCPGSTNSRAKRWPASFYAALGDQLIAEAGAQVALIGSREEMDVTAEVIAAMRERPVVLTGQTELSATAAILSLADLVISNDTGPAHIAGALARPTVDIFGPTDPVQTRPFSPSAEIIHRPPDCAPCMLRDCPIDHRCMTMIAPSAVYARAVALLARRDSHASAGVAG